jgi:alpha-tubulin suppressor-like RCC1 family protein
VALEQDGSLWAWGDNSAGQLGDGTFVNKSTPVRVGTATDWVALAAGHYYTLALKKDGSLWAWGDNSSGQLGDGTTYRKSMPVRVDSATDWVAVAPGSTHTVALKQDGSLWAWGDNTYGQLGDGTTVPKLTPARIDTATDWVAMAAGNVHTVALKQDGSLWAWGVNTYGQLGDGTTDAKFTPLRIDTATDWVAVAAGAWHTMALKQDGSLWGWGENNVGQLGDDTTVSKLTPVRIGTATDWMTVAPGFYHTAALKQDGSLWAWGYNYYGQLGDGQMYGSRPWPKPVLIGPLVVAGELALLLPETLIVPAQDAQGAVVHFEVSAEDGLGNPLPVTCVPVSGSLLPMGGTIVLCSASDAYGQTVAGSFLVIVTSNLDRAAGSWITAAEGGALATPDGTVSVSIPPGALAQDNFISVAETATSFELTSDLGNALGLYGVLIQAGGTTFNSPVSLTLGWPDADNDGVVDGTLIPEAELAVTKDGVVLAGPCSECAACDMAANTFSVQVSSLSEFCLVFIDRRGPVTANLQASPLPVPVNTAVTLTATVDDSQTGATPIGAAEYALDGGSYTAMAAADGEFNQVMETVTATLPAFAEAGVHMVQVRGWDAQRNVPGAAETLFLPVYDPSAGFVTGGGWIHSPAGAFHPDLAEFAGVTGKATFGFVARYQKGATVPTGNTEFQFKAGDLNFKSTSYQWLVVAGARAQYKGVGMINGIEGVGFMLTAIDGNLLGGSPPDRFRIKLWEAATDTVVYDNQPGADDAAGLAADGTLVQGGNVVIHAK